MSSSEGENIDLDVSGSESDDFVPVKKVMLTPSACGGWLINVLQTVAKKAPPKAAPKASVKPKTTAVKAKAKAPPKKKVLVDHDNNVEESGSDLEFGKDPSDDELTKASTSNLQPERKKKTASETYTKVCL
jgi:DNA topoisomerase-2